ncbi:IS4 family transposase, partial [Pseudomonas paracarnis]
NHLASTEKRLGALRNERGAARPGFSVVAYDPDLDQVVDLQACNAEPGQVWLADRLYCTLPVMEACEQVQTCFVIRQQAKHPRLI